MMEYMDSCNLLVLPREQSDILKSMVQKGMEKFSVIISAENYRFFKRDARRIKQEVVEKVHHCNDIEEMVITKGGCVMLYLKTLECTQELLNCKELLNCRVLIKLCAECYETKFLIRDIETECELVEIAEELNNNDLEVLRLKRLNRRVNGIRVFTNTVLVSVIGSVIPKYVKVFYMRQSIAQYIEGPIICFNCANYGHTQRFCKRDKRCFRCAAENHNLSDCLATKLVCVQCGGNHVTNDKKCKIYKREFEIQKIKTRKRCSFIEASLEFYNMSNNRNKTHESKENAPTKDEDQTLLVSAEMWPPIVSKELSENENVLLSFRVSEILRDRKKSVNKGKKKKRSGNSLENKKDRREKLGKIRAKGKRKNKTNVSHLEEVMNVVGGVNESQDNKSATCEYPIEKVEIVEESELSEGEEVMIKIDKNFFAIEVNGKFVQSEWKNVSVYDEKAIQLEDGSILDVNEEQYKDIKKRKEESEAGGKNKEI